MLFEIERKFLVSRKNLPLLRDGEFLAQGYLSVEPVVRVRIGKDKAWLTVKGRGTLVRPEFEYEIPTDDARDMLGLSVATIQKTRYRVNEHGFTWEVDEFQGALKGLWLAEIELESAFEMPRLPSWVGEEVTDNPDYTNVALAMKGRPK